MKEGDKTDRTPSTTKQNGGAKTKRGRQPNSNKGSRNNSRSNSPAILSPNKFSVLQKDDETWICENCKKPFSNPDAKMLECQRCKQHYCTKCLGKSDLEYDILCKSDSMWFCGPCKGIVERNIVTDLKIEARCSEIVKEFEQRMAAIEKDMLTKCNESDVRKIVQEELKSKPTTEIMYPNGVVHPETTVTEVISEINERNSRKNNLILYGIEECNSQDTEERKENDANVLREIASKCDIKLENYRINKIVRLGKYDKEKNKRPMLIQCDTPQLKIDILKNAHKLKGEDSEFDDIAMSHDMTKTEREEERRLFSEAKKLTAQTHGKETYKVRGPPGARRVVKITEGRV